MRSNQVVDVLTSVETTYKEVAALRLDRLSRTEVYALLERLDKLERERAALDRRLVGRLLAEGGPSVRDVARRLRVSPGEVQRRFSETA
jgi:AraC-like DNA-binding protein